MSNLNKSESFKNYCVGLAALAVPVVVALIGNSIQGSLQEKEVQGKYVEIAVGILQNPKSGLLPELREWAAKVVDNYSGVPLGEGASVEIIEKGLPEFSLSGNALGKSSSWAELGPGDWGKLWGEDYIWSCFVEQDFKITCFKEEDICVSESQKIISGGNNLLRKCGPILTSSDGY